MNKARTAAAGAPLAPIRMIPVPLSPRSGLSRPRAGEKSCQFQ